MLAYSRWKTLASIELGVKKIFFLKIATGFSHEKSAVFVCDAPGYNHLNNNNRNHNITATTIIIIVVMCACVCMKVCRDRR